MSACHKENAATNKPCREERAPRQVIEDKIMSSLEEGGKVALLLSEKDLNILIAALLDYKLAERRDNVLDWGEFEKKRVEFGKDLQQLRLGAFGK